MRRSQDNGALIGILIAYLFVLASAILTGWVPLMLLLMCVQGHRP